MGEIEETGSSVQRADDFYTRAYARVICTPDPNWGFRTGSLLYLANGSLLALLRSGEVPKGSYPTLVIRTERLTSLTAFRLAKLTTLYGSQSEHGPC
jgi:hypothetical protein